MKDHYKTGSKIHGLILFEKHAGNNTVYCMKETVKQGAVSEEEVTELTVNGKNAVAVEDIDELEGHGSSALHGVQISTGRTEAAVASEGDEFQLATFGAAEHCTAKGGIAAVDHFIHVFNNRSTWM